jgi:hypothetical protein
MRKRVSLLFIALIVSLASETKDWDRVMVQPRTESLVFEQLSPESIAPFSQIGARFDRYLSKYWYVGGTALGAIAGGRGGYATGAFQTGINVQLSEAMKLDFRCLLGGSGGGGVPVLGGIFMQPMVGVENMLAPGVAINAHLGRYISLDNSFQAWVTDIAIVFEYNHLFIPSQ